ncbi:MAG: type II secretion system protein [Planctomycetota bacterium]
MPIRRPAFTLIELLVVIAIVALLIGLLLPVLGNARDAAVDVRCQANQRTIHQSFHVYANDFDQYVPIGYRAAPGFKQFNLNVYSGFADRFVLYGWLYQHGLMDAGEAFYCPAETSDGESFDGDDNPWPPGTPGRNTLVSYGLAPLAAIPDDPADANATNLPRLELQGQRAILADSVGLPERVDSRHGDGVFALYADAAVRFIERDRFDADLELCTALDAAFNDEQQRIWDEIDKR